jgi:hypothetical protein
MPFRHAVERYTLGIAFYFSSILCNATSTLCLYGPGTTSFWCLIWTKESVDSRLLRDGWFYDGSTRYGCCAHRLLSLQPDLCGWRWVGFIPNSTVSWIILNAFRVIACNSMHMSIATTLWMWMSSGETSLKHLFMLEARWAQVYVV